LPWLLFLVFPIVDLVSTPRPAMVQLLAATALALFTAGYVTVFSHLFGPGWGSTRWELLLVAGLGAALPMWLGPSWAGLLIYVATAAAGLLSDRWIWPVVVGAALVCVAVLGRTALLDGGFILPLICLLTAFAMRGMRHLVSVNADLVDARDELARHAVAEERLRFARDLHDLLGHSLSLIALKSELAGRLAEQDPARARAEMADVEAAARRALAEVRDAVSGYRGVSFAQALAEARSALAAAGIAVRAPRSRVELPDPTDAVLGWVLREATTNALRHSRAGTVSVALETGPGGVTLTIVDDGIGGGGTRGTGLAGLAERLEALGGTLTTGSADGGGFRLAAAVPLGVPAAEANLAGA
jgi:two-component system sensor histidine kinase DesK